MTDQSRLQFTDALLEKMLAQRAGPGAPADLIPSIAAAIESTGQRAPGLLGAVSGRGVSRTRRDPGTLTSRRILQVAAVGMAVVVVAAGAGLFLKLSPALIGGPSSPPSIAPAPSATSSVVPPRAPAWTATGNMGTPRGRQTATLLPDGKVLIAGGSSDNTGSDVSLASAELYDPDTGTWTATGSMVSRRRIHTATLLPDGKVLVAGGDDCCDGAGPYILASAELYDPGTGTWTSTGNTGAPRSGHTATLLPDGKVLVAGGDPEGGFEAASAELYDPGTGTWTATGNMGARRSGHTATLLPDGKVLVAGGASNDADGFPVASAELYDPDTGSWTATGSMIASRFFSTATLLPDGKVLVVGGARADTGGFVSLASAELYDPGSGTWTTTGSMGTPRSGHTATLLPDGRVLVAGGGRYDAGNVSLDSVELYDPGSGSWIATGTMVMPRWGDTATLLADGKVLVAGGARADTGGSVPLASAELYDPGSAR